MHHGVVVLRPLPVTRFANTLPGMFCALFGAAASVTYLPLPVGLPAAGVALAAGIIVAVRGYLMEVEVGDGWVRVRGLLWTRTIPGSAVRAVTAYPAHRALSLAGIAALHWASPTGRSRWSPLVMFSDARPQLRHISRHNRKSLAILRHAIDTRRPQGHAGG